MPAKGIPTSASNLTGFEAGLEELLHDKVVCRVQSVVQQLQEATARVPATDGVCRQPTAPNRRTSLQHGGKHGMQCLQTSRSKNAFAQWNNPRDANKPVPSVHLSSRSGEMISPGSSECSWTVVVGKTVTRTTRSAVGISGEPKYDVGTEKKPSTVALPRTVMYGRCEGGRTTCTRKKKKCICLQAPNVPNKTGTNALCNFPSL